VTDKSRTCFVISPLANPDSQDWRGGKLWRDHVWTRVAYNLSGETKRPVVRVRTAAFLQEKEGCQPT
jgi:hypothetical protein